MLSSTVKTSEATPPARARSIVLLPHPHFVFVSNAVAICALLPAPAVCGMETVVGDAEVGVAVSLGAALPWLWVHISDEATADTAAAFLDVRMV
jgi:hypothetical protein